MIALVIAGRVRLSCYQYLVGVATRENGQVRASAAHALWEHGRTPDKQEN